MNVNESNSGKEGPSTDAHLLNALMLAALLDAKTEAELDALATELVEAPVAMPEEVAGVPVGLESRTVQRLRQLEARAGQWITAVVETVAHLSKPKPVLTLADSATSGHSEIRRVIPPPAVPGCERLECVELLRQEAGGRVWYLAAAVAKAGFAGAPQFVWVELEAPDGARSGVTLVYGSRLAKFELLLDPLPTDWEPFTIRISVPKE